MRILITGADGFIGRALLKMLLAKPDLARGDGAEPISEIILADLHESALGGLASDPRIKAVAGDIAEASFRKSLFAEPVDSVFHLAATLTTHAEQNFDHGLKVNLFGVYDLLEICRAQGNSPRFVFPSSIAAFGGPLPDTVDDSVAQTPQTSYGTAKSVAERLLDDYSRHGFVDGRALRLPIVLIRPGAPNPAISDRVASVVREPLRGEDAVCPLAPETRIPVASVRSVATSLVKLHDVPARLLGHTRAMNLPSLTVSIAEMVAALDAFDHPGPRGTVSWAKDDRLQAIVDGWPRVFVSEQATRLGIGAEKSFSDILRAYVEDSAPAR